MLCGEEFEFGEGFSVEPAGSSFENQYPFGGYFPDQPQTWGLQPLHWLKDGRFGVEFQLKELVTGLKLRSSHDPPHGLLHE